MLGARRVPDVFWTVRRPDANDWQHLDHRNNAHLVLHSIWNCDGPHGKRAKTRQTQCTNWEDARTKYSNRMCQGHCWRDHHIHQRHRTHVFENRFFRSNSARECLCMSQCFFGLLTATCFSAAVVVHCSTWHSATLKGDVD